MPLEYCIRYNTTNTYENKVHSAYWQFLIIPETNESQDLITTDFNNSLAAMNEFSINGYGFSTIRVNPRKNFQEITFNAEFKVLKKDANPFEFDPSKNIKEDYLRLNSLNFKVDFDQFLKNTPFTTLPDSSMGLYQLDDTLSLFDNLQALNTWTYQSIYFKVGVTDVNTTLNNIITKRYGVCQDFTHLFCAIARNNKIPTRYVSGYLHQGNGYFGDSQMHAWAEAYIPTIGWVGFDPTNNVLVASNHIKVCHGKDYQDCAPLKGIVCSQGQNETQYSVQVISRQQ
ncbi:transglutaminase-like domain-containing protein [Cellulophaga baltica]|uniref:transglutaminase-like domain-containing protein n=1 Tax=Cellulophaga baltica TaxID=76594 RepID=UPI000413EADD|nr:transglutaminase family protein [Cellulophaga baltica]AIY14208.1 transglutaminase [Cellulophaga baltica NN016038]